jgi:hypothetical protein
MFGDIYKVLNHLLFNRLDEEERNWERRHSLDKEE